MDAWCKKEGDLRTANLGGGGANRGAASAAPTTIVASAKRAAVNMLATVPLPRGVECNTSFTTVRHHGGQLALASS